jgi:4-nitrophenyl phosphatase
MGVPAAPEQVMTSALATAAYLQTSELRGASLLIVGEDGLRHALEDAGFDVDGPDPRCVVVGLDRQLTYAKLAAATLAIRAGARFVATNPDAALPVEDGFWPGAGAIVAALRTATGVEPFVVGKPAPTLLLAAMERVGATAEATAIVGDQIASDIRAGRAAGIGTILVGYDQPTPDSDPKPDLWLADINEVLATLRRQR